MTATATALPSSEAPPAPKRRRLLLPALAAVVVLGIGAAAFVVGGRSAAPAGAPAPPTEGVVLDVAEMTLNLAGPVTSYARVSFAAVLSEGADEAAVRGRFALLRDAAISEVGTFHAEALRGPEGVDELRARLSARAAELYPDGEVLRIVLTELVVQ